MQVPNDDLDLLIQAARAAGPIAMRFWRQDPKTWEKPGEGPVTEADHAVNDSLEAQLRAARPGYGWLSEESVDDPSRLGAGRVFIIDPIDGTRAFIEGEESFAIALAVVDAGVVQAGAILLPAKDKLYTAALGQGAVCNGVPMCAKSSPDTPPQVLTTKPNIDPALWPGGVPVMQRQFRPSLAYRLALVAEGKFDGMITFRDSWEWDIAAGALIAQEAGALATNRFGAPLRFNSPVPKTAGALVAGSRLHAEWFQSLHADVGV